MVTDEFSTDSTIFSHFDHNLFNRLKTSLGRLIGFLRGFRGLVGGTRDITQCLRHFDNRACNLLRLGGLIMGAGIQFSDHGQHHPGTLRQGMGHVVDFTREFPELFDNPFHGGEKFADLFVAFYIDVLSQITVGDLLQCLQGIPEGFTGYGFDSEMRKPMNRK